MTELSYFFFGGGVDNYVNIAYNFHCICLFCKTRCLMVMLELYNQRNNFVIFFHHEMAFLDKVSKTASFATGLHVACLASVSFLQQLPEDPPTQGWPKRGMGVAITALVPLDTQNWIAH